MLTDVWCQENCNCYLHRVTAIKQPIFSNNLNALIQDAEKETMACNTLQELQEFWTKTTISVISDLLKSMGKIFQEFFP